MGPEFAVADGALSFWQAINLQDEPRRSAGLPARHLDQDRPVASMDRIDELLPFAYVPAAETAAA